MNLTVGLVRDLLKNLQAFRAAYESDGVDEIPCPDGTRWSIFDLEYLYEQTARLPPRQRQAIQLCLIDNIKEKDAAILMGVSPTNPVMMYAASGIEKLIGMIERGELHRFRMEEES